MYKLLLADDEPWIRQGLREIIDWKACGIDEVWEAEDGGEALAKIPLCKPDIVIADVRMPDIDGLELCARLKAEYPEIKVIIISGYQEFEYARQAVSLGVFDYIVKPLDEKVIFETVRKCIETIDKERKEKEELALIKAELLASSALLRQEHFLRMLKEGVDDRDLALKRLKELGLDFAAAWYWVFLVEIDDYASLKKSLSYPKQEEIKLQLLAKIEDWIGKVGVGAAVFGDHDLIYGCLGLGQKPEPSLIREGFQNLVRDLTAKTGFSVTVCISEPGPELQLLPALREQAEQCRQRKFFLGEGTPLFYNPEMMAGKPYHYKAQKDELILEALRLGDAERLQNLLQELVTELQANQQGLTAHDVKKIYEGLLEFVCRELAHEIPLISEQLVSDKRLTFERLQALGTMAKATQCLTDQLNQWRERLEELKGSGKRKIIQAVLEYVETFYNQKITLATAAEYFHFNASYLSKLFCTEMGEPFTKYLMKVRIEKAKELLKNPVLKVYEVAEQVGYNDIKYFAKVFKEIEGLTPGEFRERCLPKQTKIME